MTCPDMSDVAINIAEWHVDRGVLAGTLVMYLSRKRFRGRDTRTASACITGSKIGILDEDRNYTTIRPDGRISPPTGPQDN